MGLVGFVQSPQIRPLLAQPSSGVLRLSFRECWSLILILFLKLFAPGGVSKQKFGKQIKVLHLFYITMLILSSLYGFWLRFKSLFTPILNEFSEVTTRRHETARLPSHQEAILSVLFNRALNVNWSYLRSTIRPKVHIANIAVNVGGVRLTAVINLSWVISFWFVFIAFMNVFLCYKIYG